MSRPPDPDSSRRPAGRIRPAGRGRIPPLLSISIMNKD